MAFSDYKITSLSQLYDLAKKLKLTLNYVGFAESLPKEAKNGVYIINLGNNAILGTHWTMLYIENNDAFYTDSYAMPPENEVQTFTKGKHLEWNSIYQLQGIDEAYCGIWALLSAYFLKNSNGALKKRFDEFAHQFHNLKRTRF